MKNFLLFFALAVTYVDVGNCDTNANALLSEANNCFTLKFYKELKKDQSNMVSSPFSLDVLLSMLYVGARGNTSKELQSSLGYNKLSNQDIEDAFQSKLNSLKSSDGNTLNVANSIWIDNQLTVKQSYKDVVTKYFYATLAPADFKNQAHKYTEEINTWANDKTNGLIPKLFDQDLDTGTVMVLVNAMYFKGKWQTEFQKEQTRDDTFFTTPNKPTTTKFMNQQNKFMYKQDYNLKAEILEMDYLGRNMSMTLILPNEGTTLETMEQSLTCDNFKNGLAEGISYTVDVTMPKFEVASTFDLNNAIQNVGIKQAFTDESDFNGISDFGIKISQAIQKAIIKVYEEGSEAAVVTGVGMVGITSVREPPLVIYFNANRPFIFLIQHKPSNLVLFMGRVQEFP